MKDRIEQIMQREGMKPGPFADSIGIQRSALSHILNGRNRPSLDVALKILNRFTYISTDWLLRGEGPMFRHQVAEGTTPTAEGDAPTGSGTNATFQQLQFPDILGDPESLRPATSASAAAAPARTVSNVVLPAEPPRTVSRIMIFYSDNTFENFVPEKK